MNTRREIIRVMEEENVNEGLPPQVPQGNQVTVDPSAMCNE